MIILKKRVHENVIFRTYTENVYMKPLFHVHIRETCIQK